MVTRWKKRLSLLSLVLGVDLLLVGLAGAVFAGAVLLPGGYSPQDAFQADYQNTALFRREIEDQLESALRLARSADKSSWYSMEEEGSNLLCQLMIRSASGAWQTVYSNTETALAGGPPVGYNFALTYDGGRVSIHKDGEALDIYGDGVYTPDSLWDVPGYSNRPAEEGDGDIRVYLAAIAQPVRVRGCYSSLYELQQGLTIARWFYLGECAVLGLALLLLLLAFLWRDARREARLALARRTGPVWFECKVLAVAAPPLLAPLFCLGFFARAFFSYAAALAVAATFCLAYPWLLYLAGCDLRHNEKPWRHSLCCALAGRVGRALRKLRAALSAAELALPLQRRFLRRGLAAAVCILLLSIAAWFLLYLLFYNVLFYYFNFWRQRFFSLLLATALVLLLLAPMVWLLRRGWDLLRQLGPFTARLSAVRSGDLTAPLELPADSDLRQAAEDLNGIHQGMRAALEERMKSERMKVELIANVSHDLKTPLTSVISYAELLREEEDLPEHVQDYIRILNDKAQRLSVMVQDVFEVSKAASGELSLHTERLDLGKLLRQTLADMDEAVSQSSLTFRTELPEAPVWITADGDRLYRVFQNLVQNVLEYSLEGSRVYVTLDAGKDAATVRLKNISRTELPPGVDFTARFVRGDQSRTDGGSGLGLAIASSFTAACGGALRVSTDADLFTVEVEFPLSR